MTTSPQPTSQKVEQTILRIRKRIRIENDTVVETKTTEPGRDLAFALIAATYGSTPWIQLQKLNPSDQDQLLVHLQAIDSVMSRQDIPDDGFARLKELKETLDLDDEAQRLQQKQNRQLLKQAGLMG